MDIMSNFSEILKELIFDKGLDGKSFSASVGISESCISDYTLRDALPTVENLVKFADYFQCATDFLLGREAENNNLTFKPCPPFAEQIKMLLNDFHCTAVWLYRTAKISKSGYYNWKNGTHRPSLDNVIKLADALGCRVDYILGRES